jgi:hypothetical protein
MSLFVEPVSICNSEQLSVPHETVAKPFFIPKTFAGSESQPWSSPGWWWRTQMAALVQALSRAAEGTSEENETLKLIATFCGAGLFISIVFATCGLDLSPGFF